MLRYGVTEIRILGIPMDLGAGRRGVDMGPSALRLARLSAALEELGHHVADLGNVEVPVAEAVPGAARSSKARSSTARSSKATPAGAARALAGGEPRQGLEPGARSHTEDAAPPGARSDEDDLESTLHFPEAIAATCQATYQRLSELSQDSFAIALGGDHSVSMGTIAGVATRGRTGVIWVDAHADLNTPSTSPSGNIHGMPLAHLLGLGDRRLLSIWGGGAVLRPEDVVYIGLRSIDAGERQLIKELGIRAFTMKEIDQRGVAEVAREALAALGEVDQIHVSFDADVLDPDLAPGVGTPVPGGLTYREAHLLMELLAEGDHVRSLDLVEVNPMLDVRNRTATIMVGMAASLLGKKIL